MLLMRSIAGKTSQIMLIMAVFEKIHLVREVTLYKRSCQRSSQDIVRLLTTTPTLTSPSPLYALKSRLDAFINGYSQLLTHPPTQTEDLIYIKRWLAPPIPESVEDLEHQPLRYIGAIDELEAAFVEYADDLLALESNKRSWFRRIVEDLLLLQLPLVRRFFQRTPQDYAVINANAVTIWQDDGKVDRFMNFSRAALTAVVGLGMLLGPLWVLEKCRDSALDLKLGIITAFVTLFFVLVAVATTARVVEALAAAAAYAAVITVFLQIGSIA